MSYLCISLKHVQVATIKKLCAGPNLSHELEPRTRIMSHTYISLKDGVVSHIHTSLKHVQVAISRNCLLVWKSNWSHELELRTRIMSHIRMSPGTHTNESWHAYKWVMSHIPMSHVTRTNESCHTDEWGCGMCWRRQVKSCLLIWSHELKSRTRIMLQTRMN